MKKYKALLKGYFFHPVSFIIGGMLCCLLSVAYQVTAQKKTSQLGQTALYLKKKEDWMMERKNLEKKVLHQLKVANRDYIEKELESLGFLQPEVQKLQALLHSDPQNQLYNKRYQFLTGNQNRLEFREQNFQRLDRYQEVEILQKHPVEMNRDDLKAFLARIENVLIGSFQPGVNPPDLLIKKFELLKKPMSSNEETFVINVELIKHEMVDE